jgi:hypothetical protein
MKRLQIFLFVMFVGILVAGCSVGTTGDTYSKVKESGVLLVGTVRINRLVFMMKKQMN